MEKSGFDTLSLTRPFELSRRQAGMPVLLLRPFNIAAFGGIDANTVAFVDERRHGNRHAIFQQGRFVNVGNGCALHRWLGARDGQFHRRWQVNANRRPLVKLRLNLQSRRQPLRRVAQFFAAEGRPARSFPCS